MHNVYHHFYSYCKLLYDFFETYPGLSRIRMRSYLCTSTHARRKSKHVRIRGLEMLVFRKMLRTYLMDNPYWEGTLTENVKNTFKARNFHGMQILWLRFEIREIKIPPKILFYPNRKIKIPQKSFLTKSRN